MRILAIETSCDETGIAILETDGELGDFSHEHEVRVLSNLLLSQAALHAKFGGVFPNLARREHARALVPLLTAALTEANLFTKKESTVSDEMTNRIEAIFHKEPELFEQFKQELFTIEKPAIDAVAVTSGPGLEPALWVGINTAEALGVLWGVPVSPVNHMEGHIVAALLTDKQQTTDNSRPKTYILRPVQTPALSLLISGGHTELVLVPKQGEYKILGQTRDDAVGEAFDKVARMLGLSYPGGPEISKLAETAGDSSGVKLPRPMLHSQDYDFSFSGLKTAVLYAIKKFLDPATTGSGEHSSEINALPELTQEAKALIAKDFEDSVTEVLLKKTLAAAEEYSVREIILGGGVTANKKIRAVFTKTISEEFPNVNLFIPSRDLSTDNGLMIGIAGLLRAHEPTPGKIIAQGHLRLSKGAN